MGLTTNFIDGTTGLDIGESLLDRTYIIDRYPELEDTFKQAGLWTWGTNTSGELGTGDTSYYSSPVQTIAGGTNWKQVSCGGFGNISQMGAVKTDGTLWMWGYNFFGQLGTNDRVARSSPVQTVAVGTNWKQVACSSFQTAAIKTDGTLWLWGNNDYGQLGTNDTLRRSSPVQTVAGGTDWKQVACGYLNTAAIKTDGTLWVWGYNSFGQLGTNDTTWYSSPVQTIAAGTNWKQVTIGWNFMSAIKTDGTLWVWGFNAFGQLGTDDLVTYSSPVQTIAAGTNWRQVDCGNQHMGAIKTDGTLWLWGENFYGQLATNDKVGRSSPVQTIAGGTNWKQLACGEASTQTIKTDGRLWVWGLNEYGQLATEDNDERISPVQTITGGTNWKQVSVGQYCAAAIRDDSSDLFYQPL